MTLGEKVEQVKQAVTGHANTTATHNTTTGTHNTTTGTHGTTGQALNTGHSAQPYSTGSGQQVLSDTKHAHDIKHDIKHDTNTHTHVHNTTGTGAFSDLPAELLNQRPAHETTEVHEAAPVVRTQVTNVHDHIVQPVHRHVHDTTSHELNYVHGQEHVQAEGKTFKHAPAVASTVEKHLHGEGDAGKLQARVEEARAAAAAAAPDQTIEQERTTVNAPMHMHERGEHHRVVENVPVVDRDVSVNHKHLEEEVVTHKHSHNSILDKAKNMVTGSSNTTERTA